jgi:flavodoxin
MPTKGNVVLYLDKELVEKSKELGFDLSKKIESNYRCRGNGKMMCLLIVYSYHHNNTRKIAETMAKVLEAEIKTPEQTNPEEPEKYDLVGFGAGIDSGKHYKVLLDFADNLPQVGGKRAFIFSTAGIAGDKKREKDHSNLREKLQSKGYSIIDEFQCKGFNTNSFLKVFGGMNKDSPTVEDLKHAEEFAQNLKSEKRTR